MDDSKGFGQMAITHDPNCKMKNGGHHHARIFVDLPNTFAQLPQLHKLQRLSSRLVNAPRLRKNDQVSGDPQFPVFEMTSRGEEKCFRMNCLILDAKTALFHDRGETGYQLRTLLN